MARKGTPLVISTEDLEELTSMTRSTKLDYRYVIRSRIILSLYEGKSYDQVQQKRIGVEKAQTQSLNRKCSM